MITTSNFAKSGKHPNAVAISQGLPRFNPHVRRYLLRAWRLDRRVDFPVFKAFALSCVPGLRGGAPRKTPGRTVGTEPDPPGDPK